MPPSIRRRGLARRRPTAVGRSCAPAYGRAVPKHGTWSRPVQEDGSGSQAGDQRSRFATCTPAWWRPITLIVLAVYRDIHAPPGPACHAHEVRRVASPESGRRRSRQHTPPSTRAAAPSPDRLARRSFSIQARRFRSQNGPILGRCFSHCAAGSHAAHMLPNTLSGTRPVRCRDAAARFSRGKTGCGRGPAGAGAQKSASTADTR